MNMDTTMNVIGLFLGILAILALILYFEVRNRDSRPRRVIRVQRIILKDGWKETR